MESLESLRLLTPASTKFPYDKKLSSIGGSSTLISTSLFASMASPPRTMAAAKRISKPSRTLTPTTTKNGCHSLSKSISRAPKKVLVPIGFGTEEMEAVILVDALRRAGADVTVASVEAELEIEASSGTRLVADSFISACADQVFDLVALPGGMPGSVRLRDCEILQMITKRQAEGKRLYGAICAAPAITLLPWGLLKRKKMTCHPAFFDKLPTFWAVKSNIQVSGELTTSRGPGTSFQFALSFVEQLFGDSIAREVGNFLIMHNGDNNSKKEEFNSIAWSLDHSPTVLIPVANGTEEIEVVIIIDILRRAKVTVIVASVERSIRISASQGTQIIADKLIGDAAGSKYDLIILPGGIIGAERLQKSKILKKLLKEQDAAGRIYGAVGSSSAVLQKHGYLKEKRTTSHPSIIDKLTNEVVDGATVVIDGKLITSKGLATVTDFALAIVSKLFGHARARSVAEGLVFEYSRS